MDSLPLNFEIESIKKIKIINIVGSSPNFMKIAPIMIEMIKYPEAFEVILLHTDRIMTKPCQNHFSMIWEFRNQT